LDDVFLLKKTILFIVLKRRNKLSKIYVM